MCDKLLIHIRINTNPPITYELHPWHGKRRHVLMRNGLLVPSNTSRVSTQLVRSLRPHFLEILLIYLFIYCLKIDYSLLPHDIALINQKNNTNNHVLIIIYKHCIDYLSTMLWCKITMYWLFIYSFFCANHWTVSLTRTFFASLSTRNHRWLLSIYFVVLMLTSFSRRIKHGHFLT